MLKKPNFEYIQNVIYIFVFKIGCLHPQISSNVYPLYIFLSIVSSSEGHIICNIQGSNDLLAEVLNHENFQFQYFNIKYQNSPSPPSVLTHSHLSPISISLKIHIFSISICFQFFLSNSSQIYCSFISLNYEQSNSFLLPPNKQYQPTISSQQFINFPFIHQDIFILKTIQFIPISNQDLSSNR